MRLASEDSRVVSFTVAPKGEDEEETSETEGETAETAEAPSEEAPAEEVSE